MTTPNADDAALRASAALVRRSDLMNAVTLIIATAQLIRRAGESGHPRELQRRTERIEAAARRIAQLAAESWDADPMHPSD